MKKEGKKIIDYIKRNQKIIFFLIGMAVLSYLVKIFNYSISIDTEVTINDITANDMPWFATGRWSLVIIGKFLHWGGRYNYFFSNVVMILFFVTSIILLGYLLSKILKKQEKESIVLLVLGALVFTSPILAEMLSFTMMCAEVAIGLTLISLSLLATYIAVYEKQKWAYAIAIAALCCSMGIYQAFFPLYIGLAAFIFVIEKEEKNVNRKLTEDIICGICLVLIFIASYLGNTIMTKLFEHIYHLTPSGYLTNQITWGKIAFADSISIIQNYVKSVFFPTYTSLFFNYSYLAIIIISIIYIIKILKERKTKAILSAFCFLFILMSPFFLVFLMGNSVAVRTQMNIPFLTSLLFVFYIYKFRSNKKIVVFLSILISLTSVIQFKCISDLFYSDYIRYQEDKMLVQTVFTKIDLLEGLEDGRQQMPVVFVGRYTPLSTGVNARGDTLSFSFFEWDPATEYASNMRIYGLARTLGYQYVLPTVKQVKKAQDYADELEVYPKKESITIIDDMIVVRMS